MKNRWIVNIVLLLLVAGLAAFLYLRPKAQVDGIAQFEVSNYKLAEFNQVQINFPARSQVLFVKTNGYWHFKAPHQSRADQASVHRILSIIAAKTTTKITPKNGEAFDAEEMAKYGLDKPAIRLHLIRDENNQEEFLFGTFNPVNDEQYIAHRQAVYLLPITYSEAASTQVLEMVDKKPLKPSEKIAGFDFSRLEQWEETRLNLDFVNGQWKVSVDKANPTPEALNEWLDFSWKQAVAKSVELYQPDPRQKYPSFEVKTVDGQKVHFDKMQESPELLLARPDEGLIYHFAPDEGFTMLNPPINLQK